MTTREKPSLSARLSAWLTEPRVRTYGLLMALASLVSALAALSVSLWPPPGSGPWRPGAVDFDAFWAASRLALEGHPALAYNPGAMTGAENLAARLPPGGAYWPYLYPPIFMLITLPIGLAPYLAAWPAFGLAGYGAFVAGVRRLLPAPFPWLPILAFPPAMTTIILGQTAFLSAGCFSGAMLWLDRRPALAGACLGALSFKPHLALGVPLALALARRWRAFCACGLTASALFLLSWVVLGSQAWTGFVAALPRSGQALTMPNIWRTSVSVYAAARLLGAGLPGGLAVQAAAAAGALLCLARVAVRRPGAGPEMAMLVAAAMLCTPYLMDYDLVCLALPMAWLVRQALRDGWGGWESPVLACLYAFLLPLAARTLNQAGLPLMPVLLAALLGLTSARALRAA